LATWRLRFPASRFGCNFASFAKVRKVQSSYFSDETKFPTGSIEFDHALLMKNVAHEWHSAEDLYV
jgi:hypothetical protein